VLDQGGPGEPPPIDGVPWESRRELGFWPALFRTIRLSLMEPTRFFRGMPPEGPTPEPPLGPVGSPLLYALVIAIPSVVIGILWQLIASWFSVVFGEAEDALLDLGATIFIALLTPILLPLFLIIGAAILHLILVIIGGANRGFVATFRTLCYTQGTELFQLIPICGSIISLIWFTIILVIGLAEVHRTSMVRSLIAVVLPIVLCCGFFALTILMLIAFGNIE
jgi:hypothetical protein